VRRVLSILAIAAFLSSTDGRQSAQGAAATLPELVIERSHVERVGEVDTA
jgi:hypothetical protein